MGTKLTCAACCSQVCPADWKPGEQSLNPAESDKYFESAKASQDVEETNLKVGTVGAHVSHLFLGSWASCYGKWCYTCSQAAGPLLGQMVHAWTEAATLSSTTSARNCHSPTISGGGSHDA